jgi:hypothetical protein
MLMITDASKQIGLEVNTEKTEYILLSRHHSAGQNHDIKILTDVLKMWQSSDILERQ